MNIVVNAELKAYIDPLTPDEHAALERSLLAEGCRDALVLWGDVLVDGHNRFGICQQHGIPFNTLQSSQFKSLDDVHLWMIDQHLGRRSVSDFQRGVLALRKREILGERKRHALAAAEPGTTLVAPADAAGANSDAGSDRHADATTVADTAPSAASAAAQALSTREDIAKVARLSNSQVLMIEKIQKQAAPEVVAAVKSGALSLNAAAAVSTLPEQEQIAAAQGGAEELRQAAKRVRDSKKRVKAEDGEAPVKDSIEALQARVAELEAENASLRAQLAALAA